MTRNLADFQSMPASRGRAATPVLFTQFAGQERVREDRGNVDAVRLCCPEILGSRSERRAPGRRSRELGLQGGKTNLERFVFLPRQSGHLLDGLELLAMDHVQVAQHPLRLGAQ